MRPLLAEKYLAAIVSRMSQPIIFSNLRVSPAVRSAVASNRAVVALETSIVCQGLPWPENLETAQACSAAVSATGATPAVVAIISGVAVVGASDAEVAHLARAARSPNPPRKVAARDIAKCCADAADGGTTVSATALLAARAGVRFFATGGIGGVHRGVGDSWDISADVEAIARAGVVVICGGAKSILDVPKTLEALESGSVPVVTLCPEAGEFPGFYTRRSGSLTPDAVYSEVDAARVAACQIAMDNRGMVLAVPIPRDFEAERGIIEAALDTALEEATVKRVTGRETTPFLLGRMAELTEHHSLASNVALVKNNASVAGRIAMLVCGMNANTLEVNADVVKSDASLRLAAALGRVDVFVAGGCVVDMTASARDNMLRGTSNLGTVTLHVGGVGHNVASAARSTGAHVAFFSAVGDDAMGSMALNELRQTGLDAYVSTVPFARTATYCALNDNQGDLACAVADVKILDQRLPAIANDEKKTSKLCRDARIVCLDANLHIEDIRFFVDCAASGKIPVWFEPVSIAKSIKVFSADTFRKLSYMSPNADEMRAMWTFLCSGSGRPAESNLGLLARDLLDLHGGSLWIVCTVGKNGLILYNRDDAPDGFHIEAAPVPGGIVSSTSGAGDVLAGTMVGIIAQFKHVDASIVRQAAKAACVQAAAICAVKETTGKEIRAKL